MSAVWSNKTLSFVICCVMSSKTSREGVDKPQSGLECSYLASEVIRFELVAFLLSILFRSWLWRKFKSFFCFEQIFLLLYKCILKLWSTHCFCCYIYYIYFDAIFLEWWSHILNITFSVALQQPFLIPRAILIDSWLRLHLCLLTVSPQNLPGTLGEFSTFLGTNLGEKTLQGIADHCCFKSMSKNCMSNYSLVPKEFMDQSKSQFLRKGMSLTQTNWYCYPRPWWIQLLHGQKLILT